MRFARDRRGANVDDRGDALAVGLAIAKRRQRVGGFARLRDKHREARFRERRLAVAHLGGDVDIDRNARKPLDPVFGDEAGVIRRPARRDRDAADLGEIDAEIGKVDARRDHVEIVGERVGNHFRLLVNFLGHEVAVVALVDEQRAGDGFDHRAIDAVAVAIEDFSSRTMQHRPVAFLEVGDRIGEGGERDGVGTEIHLARAVADRERRALARRDHQVVVARKYNAERERALQMAATPRARQRRARLPCPFRP